MKEFLKSRIKEKKQSFLKALFWLAICVVVFLLTLALGSDESPNRDFLVSTGVVSFLGSIYCVVVLISLLYSKSINDDE